MTTPTTPPDRNAFSQQLVHEILEMRDALVKLSLCLKDWQFELDRQGRETAEREAETLLAPMRLKQASHKNMMHIKSLGDSSPE